MFCTSNWLLGSLCSAPVTGYQDSYVLHQSLVTRIPLGWDDELVKDGLLYMIHQQGSIYRPFEIVPNQHRQFRCLTAFMQAICYFHPEWVMYQSKICLGL